MSKLLQFLAGLTIFIFGLSMLEEVLKKMAGRTFKLFLKKHTSNKPQAIASGAVLGCILQSSSVVTMMALAFAGSGIISTGNALAVNIGAGFGATLNSWVIALPGFSLNTLYIAYTATALAGICIVFFSKHKKIRYLAHFLLGFGLMFLGLDFMKISSETFATKLFSPFFNESTFVAVLVGFGLTALIQSSSATMVIVLSALYFKTMPFHFAAGVIAGAELGTTIKLIIGSLSGTATKRKVAAGNFIFNLVIAVAAAVFIVPLTRFCLHLSSGNDLIALVLFQTLINLAGIVICYPLLGLVSRVLDQIFTDKADNETFFIPGPEPQLSDAGTEAAEKEVMLFIYRVAALNLECFELRPEALKAENEFKFLLEKKAQNGFAYLQRYDHVKQAEGEILRFCTAMRKEKADDTDIDRFSYLISSIRNAMYSAKAMKDVREDEKDLRNSSRDAKYQHYLLLRAQLQQFYSDVGVILKLKDEEAQVNALNKLLSVLKLNYKAHTKTIVTAAENRGLTEKDLSTLLNMNMEVYTSCKSLISSVMDFFFIKDKPGLPELA